MFKLTMKKSKKNGFSIVEVMVSITILTIGLLGVSSLVIQNIKVQRINKNDLVASMLAQEGLELVRNLRDKNWLDQSNPDWRAGINDDDDTFAIDYFLSSQDFNPDYINDSETKLYLKDGFYAHDPTGASTIFSRLISITDYADYMAASSTVRWTMAGKTSDYVLETRFYDWR